jgi:cytochrome c oxidase subunit 3
MKTLSNRKLYQTHPYHMVAPSPWPIFTSFSLLGAAIGAVMSFHGFPNGGYVLSLGLTLTTCAMFLWFRDIVIESITLIK